MDYRVLAFLEGKKQAVFPEKPDDFCLEKLDFVWKNQTNPKGWTLVLQVRENRKT